MDDRISATDIRRSADSLVAQYMATTTTHRPRSRNGKKKLLEDALAPALVGGRKQTTPLPEPSRSWCSRCGTKRKDESSALPEG